jgi:uncharacterized damage-inducible protein DinB
MTAVQELVYLLNEAFSGRGIEETNESQSLLVNLSSVGEANWRTPPPGGTRTVESIALHVGTCKLMYDEYAFGPGKLTWDDPHLQPWPEGEAPMGQVISWLETVHRRLVDHVATLDDEDLGAKRSANWGELKETRWLISVLIQHDTYHAGEINHARSLLTANDRWKWG